MAERSPTLVTEQPKPFKSPRGLDLLDGWVDGYVCVLVVDPSMLFWSLVEQTLHESDIAVQGSWAAISRKFDEQEEALEAAADRNIHNWNEAAASDAFDRLAWLQGRRAVVDPSDLVPELLKDRVESHEGFVVRDRRALSLEAALTHAEEP